VSMSNNLKKRCSNLNDCLECKSPIRPNNCDNRKIDIYCFKDGRIIFYARYSHSCFASRIHVAEKTDFNYFDIIKNLLFEPWIDFYNENEVNPLMRGLLEENPCFFHMHFCVQDNLVSRYTTSCYHYNLISKYEDKDRCIRYINEEIKNVYNSKVEYDVDAVQDELKSMKEQIQKCDVMKSEEIISPIDLKLSYMQYLIFGEESVCSLYQDCRRLCYEKYQLWQNRIR